MAPVDTALAQAYVANVQMALKNNDVSHAAILLEHTQDLFSPRTPLPFPPSLHVNAGVGLHTGTRRKNKPNEDFAFVTTGVNVYTRQTYTLQLVADGMGGHAHGQLASRLAAETLVDTLLPQLHYEHVQPSDLGGLLTKAVIHGNAAIYAQNKEVASSNLLDKMGTTMTAVVTMGASASIANVGDSRTYLYRPGVGLRAITRDHSVVADLVVEGRIAPEAIYTHPERNQILRDLGSHSEVQVDLFDESLQHGDVLLLCSDGMWEMTRDSHIEQILMLSLPAEILVRYLIHLALQGGGLDNIGVVVSQFCGNGNMMAIPTSPLLHDMTAVSL